MSDNSLHFFINGVDVGKKIKTIPSVLYGVVDVFGQAEEVTITGMDLGHFSPSEVYDCLKTVDHIMDKKMSIVEGFFRKFCSFCKTICQKVHFQSKTVISIHIKIC